MIGRASLQKAAADVEAALKGGVCLVTEEQMDVLHKELSVALDELSSHPGVSSGGTRRDEAVAGPGKDAV